MYKRAAPVDGQPRDSKRCDMMLAVLPAATLSSLLTSLIEAPMEMFRHRVQVRMQAVWPHLRVFRFSILLELLLLQAKVLARSY